MRHKRAVVAGVVIGLAAAGTAFGATQVNTSNALDDLSVVATGRLANLSHDQQERLTTSDTADFKLDLSSARIAADGRPASVDGTWIVVPGAEGLCLLTGDDSMLCGPIAEFDKGHFALTTVPTAGQSYGAWQPPSTAHGSGKVQGMVPNGFTRVVGLDKAGGQLASTSVTNNVYELDIPTYRDLADVQVRHEDGGAITLPLGWNR
jgi:hypothetical protein